MKIELKKVKIVNSLSEETLCFSADIYVDGKFFGEAKNRGEGGETFITNSEGSYASPATDFVDKVDELVYDIYNAKEADRVEKKVLRDCEKAFCVGTKLANGYSYWAQGFKGVKQPFTLIAQTPNGKVALQKMYDRIKSELKEEEEILNTNLVALGLDI